MPLGGHVDDDARHANVTVFVSDPSAEAERMSSALRASGFLVVDVPLSMLVARVAVQRPRVILVDADADGALEAVARMRELPDADAIDVIFAARVGGAMNSVDDALAHEGSGFFARPVDVPALVRKVEALTGHKAAARPQQRPSTPPPSIVNLATQGRPASASLPPASMRQREGGSSWPPGRSPSGVDATDGRSAKRGPSAKVSQRPPGPDPVALEAYRRVGPSAPLSAELEQLLAEAEQRVPMQPSPESVPPTPEEEIEAVLPSDLLDALNEPLEEDDDDDGAHDAAPLTRGIARSTAGMPALSGASPGRPRRESSPPARTHGGTHAGTTSGGTNDGRSDVAKVGTDPRPNTGSQPPPTTFSATTKPGGDSRVAVARPAPGVRAYEPPRSVAEGGAPPVSVPDARPDLGAARADVVDVAALLPALDAPSHRPSRAPAGETRAIHELDLPRVLSVGYGARAVGRAIAARATGSLALVEGDVTRRVVLREGDLLTAASSAEAETLISFLGARGELPRDLVARVGEKFPPHGRHAGAALVAHGYVRQDQLWPMLRAHAEWLLGRMITSSSGTLEVEAEPPGRLRSEPGVFGGASGAEVFVEVVRREVAPEGALERVGGVASRVADGPRAALVAECALDATDLQLLSDARGRSVGELLAKAPESDVIVVLYALSLLGVVEVLRGIRSDARGVRPSAGPESLGADEVSAVAVQALDDEAIRARVRARLQVVDEGDYFAVLGVPHNATGYEVRRAFVELRRAFEPSRLLTPTLVDLEGDVRKIVVVLEEAYEILRDGARRERYRRAIGAQP